jgi:hypothetical protein
MIYLHSSDERQRQIAGALGELAAPATSPRADHAVIAIVMDP